MTVRASLEVDTLTIRIPMRLQRRGGRKLIMTPEGVAAPGPKPPRDETLVKALVRAHRWRRRIESGRANSITDLAEQEGVTDAYVCRAPAVDVPSAGNRRGHPRWAAAEGAQAHRDAGERAACVERPEGGPGALAIDTDPLGQVRDRGRAFASLGSQEPNNRMLGFGAAEVVLKADVFTCLSGFCTEAAMVGAAVGRQV